MRSLMRRQLLACLVCLSLLGREKTRAASSPHYSWVWGKRLQTRSPFNLDYEDYREKGSTSNRDYYYSLSHHVGIPTVRQDGTTKSREPVDTLDESHFEGGFTSLDQHLQQQNKPPRVQIKNKNIGDLHPKEVFYADDDLLIIKGGGFVNPTYEEPLQEVNEDETSSYNPPFKTAPREPPSPHNEYNGNIPTIVAPPHSPLAYWSNPLAASHYSPFALFVPAKIFANSATNSYYLYTSYPPPDPYNYIMPHYIPPKWIPAPHKNVISLLGDTKVNYLNPRPSIEPDAEIVAPNPHRERLSSHHKKPSHLNKQTKRPKL